MMRAIWGLLGAVLLAGCSQGDATFYKSLTTRYIETDDAKQAASEKLPPVSASRAGGVQAGLGGPRAQVVESLGQTLLLEGSVPAPEAQRYVEGLRDKLLAVWPYEKPVVPPRVQIVPSLSYSAESSANEVITISVGVIKHAETEDEVAFIVGHELGHLLLQHQLRRERQLHNTETGVEVAAGVAVLAAVIATGKKDGAGQVTMQLGKAAPFIGGAVAGQTAIAETIIAVIDPGWSRKQEEQADLVGTDLMTAAGYNPSYSSAVFSVIVAEEAEQKRKKEEYDRILAEQRKNNPKSLADYDVSDLIDVVMHPLSSLLPHADHPDPVKREAAVSDYRDKYYASQTARPPTVRSLTALRQNRGFAAFLRAVDFAYQAANELDAKDPTSALNDARNAQRSLPDWWAPHFLAGLALKDLQQNAAARGEFNRAIAIEGAPYSAFERAAFEAVDAGDLGGALAVMDAAERRMGGPDITWPDRIWLYRLGNQTQAAEATLSICTKSENPRLREACNKAEIRPIMPGSV